MPKYLALLRGINVSGQKLIKMQDLQSLFVKSGFENVVTYIQSGNIVFESKEKNREVIVETIRSFILKKYKFEVEVLILIPADLKTAVQKNPYLKLKDFDEKKMYVSFLSAKPSKDGLKALSLVKSGEDTFENVNQVIYFYCPGGYGKTKFSNNLVENKLKVTATTRNWNSVLTLNELLNS